MFFFKLIRLPFTIQGLARLRSMAVLVSVRMRRYLRHVLRAVGSLSISREPRLGEIRWRPNRNLFSTSMSFSMTSEGEWPWEQSHSLKLYMFHEQENDSIFQGRSRADRYFMKWRASYIVTARKKGLLKEMRKN